jgi:sterol desaturase/sphingolipid hydroxylase (fatty acid hydroxylase superfamily)
MTALLQFLDQLPLGIQFGVFAIENALLMLLCLVFGKWIDGLSWQAIFCHPDRKWLLSTLFFNTLITQMGFLMYQNHVIRFEMDFSWKMGIDFVVLFIIIDFLMYVFHWGIHQLEQWLPFHTLHHTHTDTTVVSFFVLHPLEVLGFGFIWLGVLCVIYFNLYAVMLYLLVNLVYGTLGHIQNVKIQFKHIFLTDSGFHIQHHINQNTNFGFYTSVWDRLFKTIKR